MTITKKIRFEVFKRDNFTCKYCGKSAPDVILEVDHINPRSKGGEDSLFNLVTSCFDCNRGKGKRKLSDNTELKKQRGELAKLQKEREQLKMMKKWRDEVKDIDKEYLSYFGDIISECSNDAYSLNDLGKKSLLKLIKKHGKSELQDAIETSFSQYFTDYENDKEKSEAWNKAFNYIEKIITSKKNPEMKNVYYCRAILRNRFNYLNEWMAKDMLVALLDKYEFEDVKNLCCQAKHWSNFTEVYNEWMGTE